MGNLSDKIIDDQGNARTYSSGYDSRLHYVDVNGEDKKYLLDGEVEIPSGQIDIKELSISTTENNQSHYDYGEQIKSRKLTLRFFEDERSHHLVCELCSQCVCANATEGSEDAVINEVIWQGKLKTDGSVEYTTINESEEDPQQ